MNIEFNEYSSSLICSFVDFARINAPEIPLESNIKNFYFEIIINWIKSIPSELSNYSLKIKFDYILNRLAKMNLLSLLIGSNFENKIFDLIKKFYEIINEGLYEIDSKGYFNIISIISGLIIEYTQIPIDIIRFLLKNFNKNSNNKYCYELSKKIIKDNKNLLFGIISNFLVSSEKKNEIFVEKDFINLVKELSLIGHEFLLNFFFNVKIEDNKIKGKIHGAKIFYILLKIFSQTNSIEIALKHKDILFFLIESLDDKNIKNERKKKLFKCLIKFLVKNDKNLLKKNNLYLVIIEKLKKYINNLSNNDNINFCLNIIENIDNWKIIKIISITFLKSKYLNANKIAFSFIFKLIKNKIINNFSIFDFYSNDKLKILYKVSELFTSILNLLDDFDSLFTEEMTKLILLPEKKNNVDENNNNKKYNLCTILLILFYFSQFNNDSLLIFTEYLMRPYLEEQINNNKIIENNEENKESENKYEKKTKINLIFSNVYEIQELLTFFNQYIICVDEESNPNSIKMFNSIIYVLIYYIKFIIYHFENNNYGEEHIENINKIIVNINLIIKNEITNKECITALMILLKQLIFINNEKLNEKIKELITVNLLEYVFNTNKINPSSFAVIFDTYSNIHEYKGNDIMNTLINSEDLIYKLKDNTLVNPLIFINSLLKIDNKKKYNEYFFKENLLEYILKDLKESLNSKINNDLEILKNEINENIQNDILKLIQVYNEVLKFHFYYLIKGDDYNEVLLNNYLKFLLNNIYNFFNEEYPDLIKENEEEKNSTDEEKDEEEEVEIKIRKNYINIQLIIITKYISLIFKLIENGIHLKNTYQIKFANLLLCKELIIRSFFIDKLYNKMKSKKPLNKFFNIIPMITLCLNDNDKHLSKKVKNMLSAFVKIILQKLKTKDPNEAYRLIPEVYLSYIIMYFVFNPNLNVYYQRIGKKNYFTDIIANFIRIIKKVNNNNFDSDFVLKFLNCIKIQDLSDKKIIKKVFKFGIIFNIKYQIKDINYENVKNKLIDNIIQLINSNFTTDFSYKINTPKIPTIFLKSNKEKNSYNIINNSKINDTSNFILDIGKISDFMKSTNKSKRKSKDSENEENNDEINNIIKEDEIDTKNIN